MGHTVRLEQASYRVRGNTILHPVTLKLASEKVTAILGPNGSGKSTLLKLIAGLIEPTAGKVLVDGQLLNSFHRKDLAKKLALLPQHSPVPLGMSVADLVACGRYPHAGPFGRLKSADKQAINTAINRVGMDLYASHLVDHLSGGEMQRVWLAMVLAQETGILLLDEPTSWLDIAHQLKLLEIVRQLNEEKKTTVIWILHDLNQALQYSDEIVLLNEGKIVRQGTAEQVLDTEIIADVFNVKTSELQINGHSRPLFLPVAELGSRPQQPLSKREVA